MSDTQPAPAAPAKFNWFQAEALKFLGISKSLWAFLWPQIQSGFSAAVADALPIVEPIVIGLATDPTKSGVKKAAAALATAKPALIAAGISAETNVINAAIAAAVAKLPKADAANVAPEKPVAAE